MKLFKRLFLICSISLFTAAFGQSTEDFLLNTLYEEQEEEKAEEPVKEAPVIVETVTETPAPEKAAVEEVVSEASNIEEKAEAPAEGEKQRAAWIEEILNSDVPFLKRLDFTFGFTPTIYINSQDTTISAPSPIVYPVYFGFHWPNDTFISFQPSFKIFRSYYLVADNMVLPAEIENRTADVYSILFNFPVVIRVNFFDKTNIKAFGGIATLIRIPFLASGVNESDPGYKGTAAQDLKYIRKWFAGGMRWLYLSAGVDWMFNFPKQNLQVGPDIMVYFPIGAVIADWSIDALMISAGVKIVF